MANMMKLPSQRDKKRIVIVGGGFAGVSLAKLLENSAYQVILLDKNNYHTFQPLLYQVATAGLDSHAVVDTLRDIIKGENIYVKMAEVQQIERNTNSLVTNQGKVNYDYLVLANGAIPNFFGNDELRKESFTLKSTQDAIALREHIFSLLELASNMQDQQKIEAALTWVVVGGGPTGVELAGALAELKEHVLKREYKLFDTRNIEIHLVEGTDEVLGHMSDFSSDRAYKDLKKLGVNIKLNTTVESSSLGSVKLSDGTQLSTQTLIWAAGVKGNVLDGLTSESEKKSQLIVNHQLKVKGEENIFAIGDVALFSDEDNPKGLPMLAPVAIQQGEFLGKWFKKGMPKKLSFSYLDKGTMATIGRNKAVVEIPHVKPFGGFIAWFIWAFVHIISITGLKNRLVVFTNWMWNYLTFRRNNQYIFDEGKVLNKKEKELEVV